MPDNTTAAGASRTTRRLRWWAELPLIALVYLGYSAARLLVRGDTSTAVGHGLAVLRTEQWLRMDAEHPLNRLFSEHPALGVPADFVYASLHYLVTAAVLVWLWRRHPAHYRAARTWLLLSTLIGLVGFTLYPTCPPRLLAAPYGFVDTMAQYASYGWWGGEASAPRGLGELTNQYAAMPSLHVGWALWCGAVIWRHRRTVPAKAVGIGYPLLITVVVLGTANHYLLDAVAGAAVMGLGLLLTGPALRLAGRARDRVATATARGATPAVRTAPEPPEVPEPPVRAPDGAGARGRGQETPEPVPGEVPGLPDVAEPPGVPAGREPVAAERSGGRAGGRGSSTVVSTGCETSAGERIPRQASRGGHRGDAVTAGPAARGAAAGDGAPAAAR